MVWNNSHRLKGKESNYCPPKIIFTTQKRFSLNVHCFNKYSLNLCCEKKLIAPLLVVFMYWIHVVCCSCFFCLFVVVFVFVLLLLFLLVFLFFFIVKGKKGKGGREKWEEGWRK